MNLKLVYVSVLMFGIMGLFLFMYLQDWIEEQHTVSEEKIQQHAINQNFRFYSSEEPERKPKNWVTGEKLDKPREALIEIGHSQGDADPILGMTGSLTTGLSEESQKIKSLLKQFRQVNLPPVLRPLNKTLIKSNHWKSTDEMQEKRRSFLYDFCKRYTGKSRPLTHLTRMVSRIYVEDKHKVLYCEVPKAGCSNWKRVLMVLSGVADSAANITHDAAHYGKHLRKLVSYNLKGIHKRLKTYTKVIFVRDPMERLVSAFRDKFEHPNSYYHPVFGKAIIKKYRLNADRVALATGSGVKFKEFIQYLLDSHRPVGMDTHWEQISQLCYPCAINYDYIGKFETLGDDANYFLRLIGAPEGLTFPNFKDRHSSEKRTNLEVVRQYLAEISTTERQQIYNFYYLDYLMFNYSVPYA
ncbi:carbohydrate sulfotransferase 9 [Podarcis raffonei]|uniref:carbohydrate sulfotransferase 9 n=1 Tax=Podarcis raffonei TaxID=65483 RepID=UPI0023298CA2|nr:carbohydrate sulfotransferase 9 [Podarcis raffonei]XP_053252305.1 carbohydrate sulfotransferase 9 [Podarcis raffonei]